MTYSSHKSPDAFLSLRGQDFPFLIVEVGWSEKERDLYEHARLWLWGTRKTVKSVILIESVAVRNMFDERSESQKANQKITGVESEEYQCDGQLIQLPEQQADKNRLQDILADQLLQLHNSKKLFRPLLGSVKSTLSIFSRSPNSTHDSRDIECVFSTKIYPEVEQQEWKRIWKDLMSMIPDTFASKDKEKFFNLDMRALHDSVVNSINKELKRTAKVRAAEILIRRGVISHGPSFAELKSKRGPNMEGRAAEGSYSPSEGTPSPNKKKNGVNTYDA
jgi:hypothetical protein